MNKKVLLVLLLLIPFMVNADCNKEKHEEYTKFSSSITYDNSYSKSSGKFSLTIFNIFEGMYAVYDQKKYYSNEDSEITINGIPEGTNVIIDIYANDGCDPIKRITKAEPYFNKYYGSNSCIGYEDKLTMCAHQFTSSEVTKDLLEKAIYNYNYSIDQNTDAKIVVIEDSLYARVKEFLLNWGVKIVLFVVTTVLALAMYSDKFRKIKHGI